MNEQYEWERIAFPQLVMDPRWNFLIRVKATALQGVPWGDFLYALLIRGEYARLLIEYPDVLDFRLDLFRQVYEREDLQTMVRLFVPYFYKTNMSGVVFERMDFSRAYLSSMKMDRCVFTGCTFDESVIECTELGDVLFDNCTFRGVAFVKDVCPSGQTQFRQCSFERASLKGLVIPADPQEWFVMEECVFSNPGMFPDGWDKFIQGEQNV